MYIMKHNNHNKKRELHPIGICAILFFFAFFFSIIIVDNSYESSKARELAGAYGVEAVNGAGSGKGSSLDASPTVIIDPGHGGGDPGKVGVDDTLEKDVNLQIAFKLKAELEERGISVSMLRETDTDLATEGASNRKTSDMKNRVGEINDSGAQILISIHQNSYTNPTVRGPQVFYHGSSEESEAFAKQLQEKLKAINPEYAREAKTGNDYYILNKSSCPGVIVECGFLSCPEETALLTSEEYQQKIASAIADAIEEAY